MNEKCVMDATEAAVSLRDDGNWPIYKINSRHYAQLLHSVLTTLDMSLPNKQQHSAATHAVRKAFDATYFEMLTITHPDTTYGASEGGYAVAPLR